MGDRPWLDVRLDVAERARLLLGEMTLAEKVGQTHQVANVDIAEHADLLATGGVGSTLAASGSHAGNVRDAGVAVEIRNAVQHATVEQSRLGVPLLFARDVIHGHRTVFPIPLGLAATFSPELVRAAMRVAAVEASAEGIRWTFAPMLDIARDPRWGRVAEGFGEDPWLASRLAEAAVQGFQGADLAAPDSLAACAKHFVGYGLAAGGRDYDSVEVGLTTLRNVHLRPFQAAVEAGAATVMSAFQDVDGTPMTAHAALLRGELKDGWGFDGVVVSDWNAVAELVQHGVADDLRVAARLALHAGVDVDMVSGSYREHVSGLVASGAVTEELLDDAVLRVLRLKLRLGLFEQPYADPARAGQVMLVAEHRALARRSAAESLVLLKNDGVLPLTGREKVCLVGPFADAGLEQLGTWTLDGRGDEAVTPAAALADRLPPERLQVVDARFSDAALWHARSADVVVALVGEHPLRSGEANSVVSLGLPPGQEEVLRAVHALGKPLVVVVLAGRPLALPWVLDAADAVVYAWHPGSEGGTAVADLLLGAVEPVGRLPMGLPRDTGQVPTTYLHRPTGRPIAPVHDATDGRYRDALSAPARPFGFGLGFTPVTYRDAAVSAAELAPDGEIGVSVTVVNSGSRQAVETVQLYVRDVVASVARPVRELVGVQRVTVPPGDERRVTLPLTSADLGYTDATGARRTDPGEFEVFVGADSTCGTAGRFRLLDR